MRFWRRYAEAESKVGPEVAEEDANGEVLGKRGYEAEALREGVEGKILS
jgi:hypothetical protein